MKILKKTKEEIRLNETKPLLFKESKLMKPTNQSQNDLIYSALMQTCNNCTGIAYKLAYRGSADGWTGKAYHSKVDKLTRTITLF